MPNKSPAAPSIMRTAQAAALTFGFAEAAGAHSIGLVMYNAAEAQQAVQQVEIAALGFVLAKIASASGSGS